MEQHPFIHTPRIVSKGWGREVIFANNSEYCGKLLEFHEGAKFSMHYHLAKTESWMVLKGEFTLKYFDLTSGEEHSVVFSEGRAVDIERGFPHQLICTSNGGGTIVEVSTFDQPQDSYRVAKGDSQ